MRSTLCAAILLVFALLTPSAWSATTYAVDDMNQSFASVTASVTEASINYTVANYQMRYVQLTSDSPWFVSFNTTVDTTDKTPVAAFQPWGFWTIAPTTTVYIMTATSTAKVRTMVLATR